MPELLGRLASAIDEDRAAPGDFIAAICALCGVEFSYRRPRRGRRLKFCSAECRRAAHARQCAGYYAEDRYQVKARRREAREAARGPLLPFFQED